MDYNNEGDAWEWREDYCFEDQSSLGLSKCLLNGVSQEEDISCTLDDETTPVKSCGDLAYHATGYENMGKELGQYSEPSSQVKRRRMLQFESEVLDAPFCSEEISSLFMRSMETESSVKEAMSEMSQWVAGFAETISTSGNENLDQSSEGWLADCFNDAEMHLSPDDINISGASDVQIDSGGICNTPLEYEATAFQEQPVRARQNVVFKGRKSFMRTPAKVGSSVVYPFAFIKPCGFHGDVTLKDINQRIRTPPSISKQNNEDLSESYPTSAFSGKPVVGKTKIRTEGGKGSITIMRTKG